jgi:MFS family permease
MHEVGSIEGVERMPRLLISYLLGLVGAIIGGVIGFYTFAWLEDKGFYGLAIPGAFLGLGCGLLSQHNSITRGVLCGAGALGLSLFTEWKFHPFLVDNSFSYMVSHISEMRSVTLLMIVLGTVIAFWVGKDGGFRGLSDGRRVASAQDSTKDHAREV